VARPIRPARPRLPHRRRPPAPRHVLGRLASIGWRGLRAVRRGEPAQLLAAQFLFFFQGGDDTVDQCPAGLQAASDAAVGSADDPVDFFVPSGRPGNGPTDQDMQVIKYLISQGADCNLPVSFFQSATYLAGDYAYQQMFPLLHSCAK
jgi:hypothetical protein